MNFLEHTPVTLFAIASPASRVMQAYVTPVLATLCVLASLACVFFLVNGGIQYMASTGKPENLENAKKIIKNALIGLALVIAAATVTAILSHAYGGASGTMSEKFPVLAPIQPASTGFDVGQALIQGIVDLLQNIVAAVGQPFIQGIAYFTNATPLMGDNSYVFNLWLAITGIADVIFVVVVALIGFHVMSFASFGFDEIEIKHLLPQMVLVFLLINTSIFWIDGIISFSNAMIYALQSNFPSTSLWDALSIIAKNAPNIGLAGLLVMVAFLVLNVMLLIYYVGRLITLYVGAILSPLILLLWLIPAFKAFVATALKTYLTVIFVLFVHVVILLLAASIFTGILKGDQGGQPNNLMILIVGMSALLALLKTQGVMQELSYAASTPRAAREITGSFMRGVGYMNSARKGLMKVSQTIDKATTKKPKKDDADSGNPGKPNGKDERSSKSNTQGRVVTHRRGEVTVTRRKANVQPLKTGETRKAKRSEPEK